MNNLEKLTELCEKQGRAIYTSSFRNRSSIVITYPETYEEVDKEMGGSNSLNRSEERRGGEECRTGWVADKGD